MNVEIKNAGKGPDIGAHVDENNQVHTFALTRNTVLDAIEKGNAYNINTGWIGLTSSTASAVLYFKNDEAPVNGESTFVIDSMVVAIDAVGTTTTGDMADIVIIKNATAGTIVSGAAAVDYKSNRNFGSSKTLSTSTLVYKGAEGNTLTGGTNVALFGQSAGSRAVYDVQFEVPRGSSFGVTIDTQTTAGTTSVYVALVGHLKDGKNS